MLLSVQGGLIKEADNICKMTTNYSYPTKNVTNYSNLGKTSVENYLYTEDSFNLLTEAGDKILLENSNSMWADVNKNTSSYSYPTKN